MTVLLEDIDPYNLIILRPIPLSWTTETYPLAYVVAISNTPNCLKMSTNGCYQSIKFKFENIYICLVYIYI